VLCAFHDAYGPSFDETSALESIHGVAGEVGRFVVAHLEAQVARAEAKGCGFGIEDGESEDFVGDEVMSVCRFGCGGALWDVDVLGGWNKWGCVLLVWCAEGNVRRMREKSIEVVDDILLQLEVIAGKGDDGVDDDLKRGGIFKIQGLGRGGEKAKGLSKCLGVAEREPESGAGFGEIGEDRVGLKDVVEKAVIGDWRLRLDQMGGETGLGQGRDKDLFKEAGKARLGRKEDEAAMLIRFAHKCILVV
jgi:hypothetical protein